MLAEMLQRTNLLDEDEAEYRKAIALHEQASAKFPNETVFIERLGTIRMHFFDLLCADKKFTEAEQVCRDELAISTKTGTIGSEQFTAIVGSLGHVLTAENKPAEVEKMYQEVLAAQRSALGNDSSAVAATLLDFAGFLMSQNRPEEAAQAYQKSMEISLKPPLNEHLFKLSPAVVPELLEAAGSQQASNICRMALNSTLTNGGWFNNASWFLATTENPSNRDPALAVELAERAMQINPQGDWNTVGVAYYRAGDFKQALAWLKKSGQRAHEENTDDSSYNTFFLAMAEHQLGNADAARDYYAHAIQWMTKRDPKNSELVRFQAEAEHLLGSETNGVPENQSSTPPAAK
jgi:tetratricopeptide (TPR) repeat protein